MTKHACAARPSSLGLSTQVHHARNSLKVVRIDARFIPAQVIYIHAVRYRANGQLISYPVGTRPDARPYESVAVSYWHACSSPNPAAFGFTNLIPKPLCQWAA